MRKKKTFKESLIDFLSKNNGKTFIINLLLFCAALFIIGKILDIISPGLTEKIFLDIVIVGVIIVIFGGTIYCIYHYIQYGYRSSPEEHLARSMKAKDEGDYYTAARQYEAYKNKKENGD